MNFHELFKRYRQLGGTAVDGEGAADSDPDYGMRLPDGKTCGMCKHWGRCKSLIHDLDGYNRFCDFSPSRFVDSGERSAK